MKRNLVLLCAITCLLTVFGTANAAMISINPQDSNQGLGSTFDLTIVGSDFFDGTAGGGLELTWDSTILNLNSVTSVFTGDQFFGDPGVIANGTGGDPTAGSLTGFSVSSLGGTMNADFNVATLSFTAVGMGLSALDGTVSLSDVWTDASGLVNTFATFTDGSVNVVPIPGSLLLLGTGLVGLVGIGRKKRS